MFLRYIRLHFENLLIFHVPAGYCAVSLISFTVFVFSQLRFWILAGFRTVAAFVGSSSHPRAATTALLATMVFWPSWQRISYFWMSKIRPGNMTRCILHIVRLVVFIETLRWALSLFTRQNLMTVTVFHLLSLVAFYFKTGPTVAITSLREVAVLLQEPSVGGDVVAAIASPAECTVVFICRIRLTGPICKH